MASGAVDPESETVEKLRGEEIQQLFEACDAAIFRREIPVIIGDLNAAPELCASNYKCFMDKGWRDGWIMAIHGLEGLDPYSSSSSLPRSCCSSSSSSSSSSRFERGSVQMTCTSLPLHSATPSASVGGGGRGARAQFSGYSASTSPVNCSSSFVLGKPIIAAAGRDITKEDEIINNTSSRGVVGGGGSSGSSCKASSNGSIGSCRREGEGTQKEMTKKLVVRKVDTSSSLPNNAQDGGGSFSQRMTKNETIETVTSSPSTAILDGNDVPHQQRMTSISGEVSKKKDEVKDEEGGVGGVGGGEGDVIPSGRETNSTIAGVTDESIGTKISSLTSSEISESAEDPESLLLISDRSGTTDEFYRDEFTWDPLNPLNSIGPHSGCHGLRCDYVFLPPTKVALGLKYFYPKKAEIVFREPRVMVDACCFRCLGRVMLVTLSDHYAVRIELERDKQKEIQAASASATLVASTTTTTTTAPPAGGGGSSDSSSFTRPRYYSGDLSEGYSREFRSTPTKLEGLRKSMSDIRETSSNSSSGGSSSTASGRRRNGRKEKRRRPAAAAAAAKEEKQIMIMTEEELERRRRKDEEEEEEKNNERRGDFYNQLRRERGDENVIVMDKRIEIEIEGRRDTEEEEEEEGEKGDIVMRRI